MPPTSESASTQDFRSFEKTSNFYFQPGLPQMLFNQPPSRSSPRKEVKIKKVRKKTNRLIVPGPLLGPINEADYFNHNHFNHPTFQATGIPNQNGFLCQYCGRIFKKEKYLRFHLNSHAGYKSSVSQHFCSHHF